MKVDQNGYKHLEHDGKIPFVGSAIRFKRVLLNQQVDVVGEGTTDACF